MSWLGFAVGVGLALFTWATVLKTLVLTRSRAPLLERAVILGLRGVYVTIAGAIRAHERRDNLFSTLAPIVLLVQLASWLALFFLALMFWPFVEGSLDERARARQRLVAVHAGSIGARRCGTYGTDLRHGDDRHRRDRAVHRLPADAVRAVQHT